MLMFRRAALFASILILCAVVPALARDADTVYVEGFPELRTGGGRLVDLFFGDRVRSGETVVTGGNDFAELELDDGSSIVVRESTVFTLQEVDEDGQSRSAFTNTRGSVTYRFEGITGRNARVHSANAVVGVRGTTFTVYAGDDGSSLFLVESGRIAVSAEGEEVEVGPDFAVEVNAGEAPGEPFEVLRGAMDFSGWNNGRVNAIIEDPVAAAEGAYRRLEEIVRELEAAVGEYEEFRAELDEARAEERRVFDEEGSEALEEFRADVLRPLQQATPRRYLNVRYWALSALSMRRHVFGRMYGIIRANYFLEPHHPDFRDYRQVHDRALNLFESAVGPYLIIDDY